MHVSKIEAVKQPTCLIELYYKDPQKEVRRRVYTMPFVKQTAHKAHEMICDYFELKNEWDRKLFETMLLHNEDITTFEFLRNDGQIVGVDFTQNKYLVTRDFEKEYIPIEKQEKMGIVVSGDRFLGIKRPRVLEYKEIYENRADYSLVALFNSPSFTQVKECNLSFLSLRVLQKVDLSYSPCK